MDAANAAGRLSGVFEAESLEKKIKIVKISQLKLKVRLSLRNRWDTPPPGELDAKNNFSSCRWSSADSGKMGLLQGLIGEMRKTSGSILPSVAQLRIVHKVHGYKWVLA